MEGVRRRAIALLAALALVAAAVWLPGAATVIAVAPSISMTLGVKPAIAVAGTETTWTGVITPTGNPTNVSLRMETFDYYMGGASACTPVEFCSISSQTHEPTWVFPTLTTKQTITTTWTPPSGTGHDPPPTHWDITLDILTDGYGCTGTCPPRARLYGPTPKVTIAYTTTGVVMPGSVLHVIVTATSNAWPMGNANVTINLPAGLTEPTNLTPGSATAYPDPNLGAYDSISWTAPYVMTFDTTVTAALGANLKMTATAVPSALWNGTANGSKTVHVGPVPTATPKPTTKPTTGPGHTVAATTAPGTTGPSPAGTELASTAPSSEEPTAEAPSAGPTEAGQTSANATPLPAPSSGGGTGSPASSTDGGSAVVVIVIIVGGAVLIGAVAFGLRRGRLT